MSQAAKIKVVYYEDIGVGMYLTVEKSVVTMFLESHR